MACEDAVNPGPAACDAATFKRHSGGNYPHTGRGISNVTARLLTLVALLAVALVPTAQARQQTTAPTLFITVNVTLTDSKIILSQKVAPRGTSARFVIKNIGSKPHSFTLGSLQRGFGHQTGFDKIVRPNQPADILVLYLDYRGKMPYYSKLSTDLKNGKMHGFFTVGPSITGSTDY